MRFISAPPIAVLLLSLGALTLPVLADKGQGHGPKKERISKGQAHPDHPPRPAPEARRWQQERGWQKHGGWPGHKDWKGARAAHWKNEHRTWVQRGGYGGHYIERTHYIAYFGPSHVFRIKSRPVIYRGYPRFHHHGYSFILVDPYPETWDEDWYATDEVYIYYDNGYYLYNRSRPGFSLAISTVL